MRRKKIRIIYKKLGKERCWGQANLCDNSIELDPRLKGKKHLEILLHEAYHLLQPAEDEETVIKNSILLTNLLWGEGYRRVDSDNSLLLQDNRR